MFDSEPRDIYHCHPYHFIEIRIPPKNNVESIISDFVMKRFLGVCIYTTLLITDYLISQDTLCTVDLHVCTK